MKNPFISTKFKLLELQPVSPKLAAYLLEHYNPDNPRDLDYNEAKKRIARAIIDGDFIEETGNTVSIEKQTGYIANGQTRFAAIVESGKTVRLNIAVGVPRKARILDDTHRPRNMGVSWAASLGVGKKEVKALKRAAAVARMWLRFVYEWKDMRFTRMEMLAFYLKHRHDIDAMMEKRENKNTDRAGFRAALAFYSTINPDKARYLFDTVSGNGADLKNNSPELVLRNYFSNPIKWHPEKQLKYDFAATLSMCWALEHNQKVSTITYKFSW